MTVQVALLRTLKHHVKPGTKKDSFYLCDNGMDVQNNEFLQHSSIIQAIHITRQLFFRTHKVQKPSGMELQEKCVHIDDLQLVSKCWVIPTTRGCCIV